MDFERFKKINDDRMNYGELEDASVVSSYRNSGCGDGYRLYLKVEGEGSDKRITDASYTTTGCGFGLLSLAMVTELIKGKTLAEASAVTAEDIDALFEFPPKRKNYPETAAEALHKAVEDFHNGTGLNIEDQASRKAVLSTLKTTGHLRDVDLRQLVLENENFENVDFQGANLSHALLTESNFRGAKLKGVSLRGAFLNRVDLRDADLQEADLRWAKLTGARLDGAKFDGAVYDVGTRLDAHKVHLYEVMKKSGAISVYTS